ncbi:hypothetical protein F7725_022461 [Dissostichus mawsoni]|uniref:Translin-associated factor X-interacting protein 1 N-terminal domain-containing protein n=1 Tax=Dissostichus mawsoni TaxID=36200 RepID=A0A7J5YYC8_DISMA|nr:hypothetical protein F7725_022461 [Dissostichus mawsoni]
MPAQRKPQLLKQLESYVHKELQIISSSEPQFQEQRLQVYQDAFGCFIKEFKTYQPLLSAIKREYENTIAYQQDQIRELEPLRSHVRSVTEECERKVQARWEEERSEIGALKTEKHQLQRVIEAMKEKETATQAVVERLQSDLSAQYLQYREQRDARQLLIWQINDLTRGSVEEEHPADGNSDTRDPVQLQLSLKVCRRDLTTAQEELTRMKAEYWDLVPRRNWDALEQTHQQNLSKVESDHLSDLIDSESPEKSTLTVQEFRMALRTAFPLKSDEEINELVTSAQSDPDGSDDSISSQRLHSLLAESVEAGPPALEESEGQAAENPVQATD